MAGRAGSRPRGGGEALARVRTAYVQTGKHSHCRCSHVDAKAQLTVLADAIA